MALKVDYYFIFSSFVAIISSESNLEEKLSRSFFYYKEIPPLIGMTN